MTPEERIEWLEDLESDTEDYAILISQRNYEREKYLQYVRTFLKPGVNLMELMDSFSMVYDLDNAAGAQLDTIGSMIGASRMLNYVPSDGGSREMDDDEFRMVLKLTIAQNTWDGTLGSLGKIYNDVFQGTTTIRYEDEQDMSVIINVFGDLTTREVEILERSGLMLVPVGVSKEIKMSGGSATISPVYGDIQVTGMAYNDSCIARGVNI